MHDGTDGTMFPGDCICAVMQTSQLYNLHVSELSSESFIHTWVTILCCSPRSSL
jgi:hypothetical protein